MKPLLRDNQYFSAVQDVNFKVTVWDTHLTVPSKGIIYRPATALNTFGSGISLSIATAEQLNNHFDQHTLPGLTDANGNEVYGRIPLIHDYWGTGAPVGVRAANRVVLRISGFVKKSGRYALVFTGRGQVRMFHNGVSVLSQAITEHQPGVTNQTRANRVEPFRNYNEGDRVDIFFWAIQEPWGGLSIRVTDNEDAFDSNYDIVWEELREADILSASWMDDGEPVTATVLPDVMSATLDVRREQVVTARIVLALAADDDYSGWRYDAATNTLVQNGVDVDGATIRVGHRIRLEGGYGDDSTLLPEFTGFIDNIVPSQTSVTLECKGFEHRLVRQISENFPDRISYASFGYTRQEGVKEPVWAVPAYDHWPYEHAIKDMCYRAWLDPSLLTAKKLLLPIGSNSYDQTVTGAPLFQCRSLSGDLIRISRQPHYGNPLGRPDRQPDDEYLTKSEISQSVYQRISDLVKRIGYQFYTDAWGNVVFRPVNNPVAEVPLIDFDDGDEFVHPSAIGGKYLKYTGTAWSHVTEGVKAGRIDLVVGKGPGLGSITVTVTRQEDGATVTNTFSLDHPEEVFFYDQVYTDSGDNVCSLTILQGEQYGTYNVVVTASGGAANTEYRIDALRIFEQDPSYPHPAFQLRTFENTLELTARSNANDRLNDAVVTGKRQTTLTDSSKVHEQVRQEFVVSRAQDTHSILNPGASNYMGARITAFLSDEAIADQDLANWTSSQLVAQYRLPHPDATVRHTALPVLELLDPIFVRDDKFGTFDGTKVMWVNGFQTEYRGGDRPSAITTIEATAFPAVPSFEPRHEIDLSLFGGKPVINLDISYTSLSGTLIRNPGLDQAVAVSSSDYVSITDTVKSDAGVLYINIPADAWSTGSELLQVTGGGVFKNYPYYEYYRRVSPTRLNILFNGGSGGSVYGPSAYGANAGAQVTVRYLKITDPYGGESPFYDPYTSELDPPRLVTITFDALVSGFYRVSVVDAKDRTQETTIAWLTEPGSTDPDPEAHWTYLTPGVGKTFRWDGVDTIGTWNRKQSATSIWDLRGAFPEKGSTFEIGAGFYAQNDQSTSLTHISGEVDGVDPAYPVGKYAQFYIKIECMRDTDSNPLVVDSGQVYEDGSTDLYDTSANTLPPRFIYYHLPEPNKITVDIEDWNDSLGGAYNPNNPGNAWSASPDTHATFRDTKPIRIRMTPVARKGVLFNGDATNTHVKVGRVVHLAAIDMDESLVYLGEPWNTRPNSGEKKRIIARRTVNDEHTLVFEDADFMPGDSLTDWVFYPSLFEDDFGRGEEPLRYLDYLQLFEVPHWNPNRRIGEARSRFLLGYLAYLFYFSVYTQDRSGRLVWAIDPTHVDRTKILQNDQGMQWPSSLERHQRRVIYVRQWWDSNLLNARLGDSSWQVPEKFRGAFSDRFDPFDNDPARMLYPTNGGGFVVGDLVTPYVDPCSEDLKTDPGGNYLPLAYVTARDFGNYSNGNTTTVLGKWTWENDDVLWIPNPTRDFHPYYVTPPMPLVSRQFRHGGKWWPTWAETYIYVMTSFHLNGNTKEPADEAKFDTWHTFTRSYTTNPAQNLFAPGRTVESWFRDKDGNPTTVQPDIIEFQKIDEVVHYEECRGGWSNGPRPARDIISITGGDPYYLNPKRYLHFRSEIRPGARPNNRSSAFYCDVDDRGWFSLTFRHTYVWESASLFPVNLVSLRTYKHAPWLIDHDLTRVFDLSSLMTKPTAYDPGAWAGWKDDHPSPYQAVGAFWDAGTCTTLHWRSDFAPYPAGGICELDNPTVDKRNVDNADSEDRPHNYTPNSNIFHANEMPNMAVGPRLPETRRVLFGLTLVNERRTSQVML